MLNANFPSRQARANPEYWSLFDDSQVGNSEEDDACAFPKMSVRTLHNH